MNSTIHSKIINNSFSHFSKNCKKGNVQTHFMRSALPSDTKFRQYHNKLKLYAIIPDEHTSKNIQENISKSELSNM